MVDRVSRIAKAEQIAGQALENGASGGGRRARPGQRPPHVYTVEAHLSRVYAKRGIRSRGQLARRLSAPA